MSSSSFLLLFFNNSSDSSLVLLDAELEEAVVLLSIVPLLCPLSLLLVLLSLEKETAIKKNLSQDGDRGALSRGLLDRIEKK